MSDKRAELQNFSFENDTQFFLPSALREISGLSFINNRIYAHQDENGTIFIIDPATGKIEKQFTVGKRPVKKDFEGIAAAGEYIYLVTSAGVLYEFKEPAEGQTASFKEYETPLNGKYDVEGLCYDDADNTLLMACKEYPNKNKRNVRTVFAFDLNTKKMINKPKFIISISELKEKFDIRNFSPSGIEKHKDGNYYILSSNEKAIAVLSHDGAIIEAVKLPGKHMQPEGITFLGSGHLMISDEGGKDDAELTIYYPKTEKK